MNKQDSVKKVMKQNFEKKDDIEHDGKEDYLQKISIWRYIEIVVWILMTRSLLFFGNPTLQCLVQRWRPLKS